MVVLVHIQCPFHQTPDKCQPNTESYIAAKMGALKKKEMKGMLGNII
jgi:hypothetical protein